MRRTTWMTALTLTAWILTVGACREGAEEGDLEIGGDTLQIDIEDEDVEETARDARGTIEGALEETGEAVGEAVEKTGEAIGEAAEETGAAVDKAMEETGETLERAGREMKGDEEETPPDSQ